MKIIGNIIEKIIDFIKGIIKDIVNFIKITLNMDSSEKEGPSDDKVKETNSGIIFYEIINTIAKLFNYNLFEDIKNNNLIDSEENKCFDPIDPFEGNEWEPPFILYRFLLPVIGLIATTLGTLGLLSLAEPTGSLDSLESFAISFLIFFIRFSYSWFVNPIFDLATGDYPWIADWSPIIINIILLAVGIFYFIKGIIGLGKTIANIAAQNYLAIFFCSLAGIGIGCSIMNIYFILALTSKEVGELLYGGK